LYPADCERRSRLINVTLLVSLKNHLAQGSWPGFIYHCK
jgi:hypothetical protein